MDTPLAKLGTTLLEQRSDDQPFAIGFI